jgi:TIR domain
MARSEIFISWSGERSRDIAEALKEFFGDVLPHTDSWISSDDLRKGARWLPELDGHLRKSTVGVVVVTPENKDAPWLSFEGGVIAGTLAEKKCCPVVCGLDATDLTGPLAQFQATEITDKEEVLRLVQSINEATGEQRDERVTRWFDRSWDALSKRVAATLAKKVTVPRPPTAEELLREILSIVRAPASGEMMELVSRLIGIQEHFKAELTSMRNAIEVLSGRSAMSFLSQQWGEPAPSSDTEAVRRFLKYWHQPRATPSPPTGPTPTSQSGAVDPPSPPPKSGQQP